MSQYNRKSAGRYAGHDTGRVQPELFLLLSNYLEGYTRYNLCESDVITYKFY